MMRLFVKSGKRLASNVALFASFVNFLSPSICYSKAAEEALLSTLAISGMDKPEVVSSSYTVNFNNVPIIEVIRFVSKITNMNFVFSEQDVQFNVTIISEEPISARNIMSALIQVLRINQLTLLEQDNSLIITKSGDVNQIPTIVSGDIPSSENTAAPIITRVFRIKNASVSSVANIIRPLTSRSALIEVSLETRQLIVTDISTNVDKIGSLLASLDAPHTPLEIDSYEVKNISPTEIITLTERLLSPFTEGNPLIFVPQIETNTIFIVSTPYLIERALTVMEDIDLPSKAQMIGGKPALEQSIHLYKIQHKTGDDFLRLVGDVATKLQESSATTSSHVIECLRSAQYIADTNSVMFIADTQTWDKVSEILIGIDASDATGPFASRGHFFMYTPKYQSGESLYKSIQQTTENLQSAGLTNAGVLNALSSVKWVPSNNSLIFTGDSTSLQKVQEIIATIDTPSAAKGGIETFIYKPNYATEQQLTESLEEFALNLNKGSAADASLQETIRGGQWLAESKSFVFKGSNETISRLKDILVSIDNPQLLSKEVSKSFFIYKLQYAPGNIVLEDLNNMASLLASSDSSNKALVTAIGKVKFIKENNTLLITGPANIIEQIKSIIGDFDIPSAKITAAVTPKSEFFIYKPLHQTPVEIVQSLSDLSADLQDSGLIDADLLHTMSSGKIVTSSQSILFTGTLTSLEKLKSVLQTVDTSVISQTPVKTIGATTFLIYKIKIADHTVLLNAMKNFSGQLAQANIQDKQLFDTINSARYVTETNSLLFTGPQETLKQVESIAEKFDIAADARIIPTPTEKFVVYNPKYQSGEELITVMTDFMRTLQTSGLSDPSLYAAITNLKYIDRTHSLIITGSAEAIQKVEDLLQKFDIPSKDVTAPSISTIDTANFLIYKLQYHKGSEIQAALKQISVSLAKGSSSTNKNIIDAIDSLQWIEVTNSLLGTGEPEVLSKLQELIESIDVPLRQVFIEVLVIKTDVLDGQNFGLQWGAQIQYLNKTIGAGGNFPVPPSSAPGFSQPLITSQTPTQFGQAIQNTTASTPPAQGGTSNNSVPFTTGFDLGVIGDIIMHKGKSFISLGSLVNALQVDSTSTVVMNPKIITQDGHTSTIFVGQNIPFTGSFVSNTTNSTVQTSNIEYRDVGTSLTITPTLGTNNVITLDINQDISEQINATTSVNGAQVNGIQTTHTSMNTRVHVPDNHFLVLSGMINESKVNYRSGIPCLGGLPVVGALFSENDRGVTKNNIIIFLKPIIIDTFETYDKLTEEEEALMKQSASIQAVKEQFDQGTEMIKSIGEDK